VCQGCEYVIRLDDSVAPEHRRRAVATNPHRYLLPHARADQVRDSTPSQIMHEELWPPDRLTRFPPGATEVQHGLSLTMEQEITHAGTTRAVH
jgi:hypothetical protein